MRPCDTIITHLLAIGSSKPEVQSLQFEDQGTQVQELSATVQHISNRARYSFITEKKLRDLILANHNSNFPTIKIDNDTVVILQWHYPDAKNGNITKHLVVRESSFDIILRREDWELPIQNFLQQTRQRNQLPQTAALLAGPVQQSGSLKVGPSESPKARENNNNLDHQDPDSGNETEPENQAFSSCSRRTSETSISEDLRSDAGQTPQGNETATACAGDDDQEVHSEDSEATLSRRPGSDDISIEDVEEGDKMAVDSEAGMDRLVEMGIKTVVERHNDWADLEISEIDTETDCMLDDPDALQEDPYWHWSSEEGRWFHELEDSTKRWFPEPSKPKACLGTS